MNVWYKRFFSFFYGLLVAYIKKKLNNCISCFKKKQEGFKKKQEVLKKNKIMSKYIHIYNKLTKIMGLTELIFLEKIAPCKNMDNNFIIGPFVYKKFVRLGSASILHFKRGRHFLSNELAMFKDVNYACCYDYKNTDVISDINDFEDYNKFLMDSEGNVFTTPTGFLFLNYYYLGTDKADISNGHLKIHLGVLHRVVFLKNKDLFRGSIRTVFLLKKKYKLPRFITFMIIIALCKSHFSKRDEKCEDCVSYNFSSKCYNCDKCDECFIMKKKINMCIFCRNKSCKKCKNNECDECNN